MKRVIVLLFLSFVFLLNGCGADRVVRVEEQDKVSGEKKDYHFVFVCPFIDNEYWAACIEGIEQADKELGTVTEVIGPRDSADFSTVIVDNLAKAIEMNPDGIMAYAGIEEIHPLINLAGEKNIPFVCIDSDAPDTTRVAYVGKDSYNAGYQAGEALVQLVGDGAEIGVLVSSHSAEKETEVLDAFRDAIADYNIEIVAVEETDADPETAAGKTEMMLQKYPRITAMFNTCGYNVTGAARVKEKLQRNDLILVGFDDIEENLKFVREGVIDALFAQLPEQMGYKGVHILKEYVEKGRLSQDNYGTRAVMVTKENIDTYKE